MRARKVFHANVAGVPPRLRHGFAIAVAVSAAALGVTAAPAQEGHAQTSLERVDQRVHGIRLRDEVTRYISTALTGDQKKQTAATRFAEANQRILDTMSQGSSVTQEIVTKTAYAGLCLASALDKKGFVKHAREITARTFDNQARVRAHDEFAKQAYGMSVATSDEVDPCEAAR